jgi:hypothetical protein
MTSRCCDAAVPGTPATPDVCALCGMTGKPVDRRTVAALVRPDLRATVAETQYYFLETPGCDVVYFAQEPPQYFFTTDLTVRVGSKVAEDPVPVCYCFEKTERMVIDDYLAHDRSTIFEEITAHVKAGECACEVKNPAGRCCLGNVSKAIQKARRQVRAGRAPSAPRLG